MVVNLNLQKNSSIKVKSRPQNTSNLPKNHFATKNLGISPYPLHAHRAYANANINFTSRLASHKSWGAAVDATTKNVNFKLFSWKDAQKVFVQVIDRLAIDTKAPVQAHDLIEVVKDAAGKVLDIKPAKVASRIMQMAHKGDGVFEKNAQANEAKDGEKYRFIIVKNNGEVSCVKDPYSQRQEHYLGWSTIHDHSKYQWNDKDWMDGKVKERMSRQHSKRLLKSMVSELGLLNKVNGNSDSEKRQRATSLGQILIESAATGKIDKMSQQEWEDLQRKNHSQEIFSKQCIKEIMNNGLANPYNHSALEIHIDSLTNEGTFEAAKKAIEKARSQGFNALEIMPVEGTPGFNWGYDGIDKHAVREDLGGPDKFKELVDHAHKHKLNVILDFVPNHMGPDGNLLGQTGPYIKGPGPFGDDFNYEGQDNENVKEYIVNAALTWAREYHVDGLRADMTKFMASDYTMKDIAVDVHSHHPDVFLIAEDGRGNDPRVTRPLEQWEEEFENEDAHANYTDKIKHHDPSISLNNLGYDSEWDFPYTHNLHDWLMGKGDIEALHGSIMGSQHRVKYSKSHDEVGNEDAIQLVVKSMVSELGLFNKVNGNNDCEKGQRAANLGQVLAVSVATGEADKMSQQEWEELQRRNHSRETFSKQCIKEVMYNALGNNKLGEGLTRFTRGPKMTLQGNQSANLSRFKFARTLPGLPAVEKEREDAKKGYDTGLPGLLDSKLDAINYSEEYKKTMEGTEKFIAKMHELMDSSAALQHDGHYVESSTVIHNESSVYALHRKGPDGSEMFAVCNRKPKGYDNYGIPMPQGKWEEVINSDAKEFEGSGKWTNKDQVQGSGNTQIKLPSNGMVIFKKVG